VQLQVFSNRMEDLFPMLVNTMLPSSKATLGEVALPNVLETLAVA
jgi:hypothetical protein